MLLTGKWSGYNSWDNYISWDPNSTSQEGSWEYDQASDVLVASGSQDAFSGAVCSQYLPWDDYTVETLINVSPGSIYSAAVGLAFRWQDNNNFYFFLMDGGTLGWNNYLSIGKVENGTLNYLSVEPLQSFQWIAGRSAAIRVTAIGSSITVTVDGVTVFNLTDQTFGHGAFGPLTICQPGACFSSFQAYLMPIQSFQSGVGDMQDCKVMPPTEQELPVPFQYGVRPSYEETQPLEVYPERNFSYMMWAQGYEESLETTPYDCLIHAYPSIVTNMTLTATGSYPVSFNYTLGANVESIVETGGQADIVFVVDSSSNMRGTQSLAVQAQEMVATLEARSIDCQFGVVGFYGMPEIQIGTIAPSKEIDFYADTISIDGLAYPGSQIWQVACGSNGWTDDLNTLKTMVNSIIPLTTTVPGGQPVFDAINFAYSTYQFRPHARVYIVVISNSEIGDYDSSFAVELASAIKGGTTLARGMVLGAINNSYTLGYTTVADQQGVITLTNGSSVDISLSDWSILWGSITGMAFTPVTQVFSCDNLPLTAVSPLTEAPLTLSVSAHDTLMPYFPANTLTSSGYTVSTTYTGVYVSVISDGSGCPLGWAMAIATSYTGSWNLSYSVYEYESWKPVAKASSFLPANQSGRLHPGVGLTYTLTKTSGLGSVKWVNAGAVANSNETDTIAISTNLFYSSSLTGTINDNDTNRYAMPDFVDGSDNPMPAYPVVMYILTDVSRDLVHFKWASGTVDTSVAIQITTSNPTDQIIITAPTTGENAASTTAYIGYASVNGLLPLLKDGDGLLNAEMTIPSQVLALSSASNMTSVQYVIGYISDAEVTGTFLSTGTNTSYYSDDIVVFACGQTTSEVLTTVLYGEETIVADVLQPDEIYSSPPYELDTATKEALVVRSLTPGVEVWVGTDNSGDSFVYARDQSSSIFGSWYPFIHSGYFTIGDKQYYLFAEPQTDLLPVDVNLTAQFEPLPQQGAPVVIYDETGVELHGVTFTDSAGRMTLYNTEYFTGLSVATIYLIFKDIEDISVTVNGADVFFSRDGNAIQLTNVLGVNDSVVIHYCLSNSFTLTPFAELDRQQNLISDIGTFLTQQLVANTIFEGAYLAPQYL